MKRRFFSLALLFLTHFPVLFAQDAAGAGAGAGADAGAGVAGGAEITENTENEASLPRTYRNLTLGMPLSELKEALKGDFLFDYRESDVSFLPKTRQNLIDTAGTGYLSRAFFQLKETAGQSGGGSLFIMAFSLNTAKLDYYSVYTHLAKRYGPPSKYSPKEASWEDGQTRLSLERPLTVKYIDLETFNEIFAASNTGPVPEILFREEFLEDF